MYNAKKIIKLVLNRYVWQSNDGILEVRQLFSSIIIYIKFYMKKIIRPPCLRRRLGYIFRFTRSQFLMKLPQISTSINWFNHKTVNVTTKWLYVLCTDIINHSISINTRYS